MRRTAFLADFYKVLGVSKNASAEDIKKAYKKKATKLHPDVSKSPNAGTEFSQLNEAYETLKDPNKRNFYNGTGKKPQHEEDINGYNEYMKRHEEMHARQAHHQSQAQAQAEAYARAQAQAHASYAEGFDYQDMDPEQFAQRMHSRGAAFRRFESAPWESAHEGPFYARPGADPYDVEFEGRRWGYDGRRQRDDSRKKHKTPPRRPTPKTPQRGQDVTAQLSITFDESIEGTSKTVTYKADRACWTCGGSAVQGRQHVCPECDGEGMFIQQVSPSQLAQYTCDTCEGSGSIKKACSKCEGNGTLKAETSINIGIPPGMDTGSQLRIVGQGGIGSGDKATAGDLIVKIKTHNHGSRFVRAADGALHTTVVIPLSVALTGGKVKIKGLRNEDVTVEVPQGTHHLSQMALEMKGAFHMPTRELKLSKDGKVETKCDGHFGKVIGHFVVTYPPISTLSEEQVKLLASLPDTGAHSLISKKIERETMTLLRSKYVSTGFASTPEPEANPKQHNEKPQQKKSPPRRTPPKYQPKANHQARRNRYG